MSPKIQAATIVEQRAMRQRQLIDAALAIALESGTQISRLQQLRSERDLLVLQSMNTSPPLQTSSPI
jgi:hypothetical protein